MYWALPSLETEYNCQKKLEQKNQTGISRPMYTHIEAGNAL